MKDFSKKNILSSCGSFEIAKLLRFLFSFSAIIMGIICPLIAYQFTGSLSIMGLVMFFEWVPKLLIYIYAQDFLNKFGMNRIHPLIEKIRFVSLLLLLLSLLGHLPWWMIIFATASIHSVLATMNVAYETNIKSWTSTPSIGQAQLLKIDTAAGISAMSLCFFATNMVLICILVIVINISILLILHISNNRIYINPLNNGSLIKILKPISYISKMNKRLWGIALIGLSCGIPLSAFLGALPFFLEYAMDYPVNMTLMVTFSFIRMIAGYLLLHCAIKFLRRRSDYMLFGIGILISLFSIVALLFAKEYVFVLLMLLYCASCNILYPWQRTARQSIMNTTESELAIGIFIAIQGAAVVLGALVISVIANEEDIIKVLIVVYVALLLIGLILCEKITVKLPNRKVRTTSNRDQD